MKTSEKFLHWIPRVICILAILFVSMFALDSFGPGRTIWQQLGAFLVHLVPTYILIALLVIAWKWEFTGGIILTLAGIAFSIFLYVFNFQKNHSVSMSLLIVLMIGVPFVIAGILFIMNYYLKRRKLVSP